MLEKLAGSRVLVTGGLGFVGHNLVKALVDRYSCRVTVVDDCSNSSPDTLGKEINEVEFHNVSVLDEAKFLPLLDNQEFIFHLACVQISASGDNALLDLRVNAKSTLMILEHLRKSINPMLTRFIYSSSCSIYGSSLDLPVSEQSRPNLLSHYAASKFLGESYVGLYNVKYDLPTCSLRYSNVYGDGQSPRNPYCGVLGHFVHRACFGEELHVYGDGEQTRDYTFISDTVDATLLAAVHPRAYGEVFNVGTSVETSVNDLCRYLKSQFSDLQIEYHADRDIDNIRRRCINIEHIHRKLGWIPKVNIRNGIQKTVDWYRSNMTTATL